jgi:hypothetical protein
MKIKRTPKVTLRFNAWELLAIEEALRQGLPFLHKESLEALISKIEDANERTSK